MTDETKGIGETTTHDEAGNLITEIDLALLVPVTVGKDVITELHLSEPTMKELRAHQKAGGGLDGLAVLIQLNTKCLPAVVDRLAQRDIDRIDAFFGRFSPPAPAARLG